MNCLACHSRDGEGGLSTDVVEQLRKFANAENAEAVAPPTLTGVGHKLRTAWMKQVLTAGARARPWMSLRMPQFGDANVGRLPEEVASLEGTQPDDDVHKTPLSAAKIEAGRTLIGKNAFGCISCHDLAGIANTGTRGPDLAGMNQRVRYEWYLRWMEQPQRMQPGTRMPQVFLDGKSLVPTVLNADAAAQADAIWGYLSLGPGLPLPEGMQGFAKGMILTVKDKPILLRTFMPEAGSRAIAIGFPSGVSAAFDAHTCRLAYAWTGQFLDAAPVWDGRGGNPAKVLGTKIWNAPAGCPVSAGDSAGRRPTSPHGPRTRPTAAPCRKASCSTASRCCTSTATPWTGTAFRRSATICRPGPTTGWTCMSGSSRCATARRPAWFGISRWRCRPRRIAGCWQAKAPPSRSCSTPRGRSFRWI